MIQITYINSNSYILLIQIAYIDKYYECLGQLTLAINLQNCFKKLMYNGIKIYKKPVK